MSDTTQLSLFKEEQNDLQQVQPTGQFVKNETENDAPMGNQEFPLEATKASEKLSWDPKAEITISGEEFHLMNSCLRQVAANMPIFSMNAFLFRAPEVTSVLNALATCEKILTSMKEKGIATPLKGE